jgi:hypothetical protein
VYQKEHPLQRKNLCIILLLKLTCKFGGREVATREKRKRSSRSIRQGRPFEVYITLSEDGTYLQVRRISKEHNHPLKKKFYERLPRQRRATRDPKVAKEMEDALKLQVNHKLLKERIERTTGKKITLKDISNVNNMPVKI